MLILTMEFIIRMMKMKLRRNNNKSKNPKKKMLSPRSTTIQRNAKSSSNSKTKVKRLLNKVNSNASKT